MSEKKEFKIIAVVKLLAFIAMTAYAGTLTYRGYLAATLKAQFNICASELGALESLQKKHMEEHGEYADSFDPLYENARKLCPENEYFCGRSEEELKDACRSVALSIAEDGGYVLEARTKDSSNCYIRITPEGVNRWHYWECKENNPDS